MDRQKSFLGKKAERLARRSASLFTSTPLTLNIQRRRDTTREEDSPNAGLRQSSVPSDLGPHGSAKHIHQNRQASGASQPLMRRASEGFGGLKRALSKGLSSTNTTAKSKVFDTSGGDTSLEAKENLRSAVQDGSYSGQLQCESHGAFSAQQPQPLDAYPHGDFAPHYSPAVEPLAVAPHEPQLGSLKINAEAFQLVSENETDTYLECAGVLTFPLEPNEHCSSDTPVVIALVLDNTAFSSERTWKQVCATVRMLFDKEIVTEADYLTLVVTQPNDHDEAVLLKCGHYSYFAIASVLHNMRPFTKQPLREQIDIAISRATDELLEMWGEIACPNIQFGHIIVLTANTNAVHVEFAPTAKPRKTLPVYMVACSPVLVPASKNFNLPAPGIIKAQVGPRVDESFLQNNDRGLESWSDLRGLFSQIRSSSVPGPMKDLTIGLAVGALDPTGKILVFQEFYDRGEIKLMYPGEKVPFTFRMGMNNLIRKNNISVGDPPATYDQLFCQHEEALDRLSKIYGKDLYIVAYYDHPHFGSRNTRIQQWHKLGALVHRIGEYNEPRAALLQSCGRILFANNELHGFQDLFPTGTPLYDCREEFLTTCKALIEEMHYSCGSNRSRNYTPSRRTPSSLNLSRCRAERRTVSHSQSMDAATARRNNGSLGGLLDRDIPSSPSGISDVFKTPESFWDDLRPTSAIPPSPLNTKADKHGGRVYMTEEEYNRFKGTMESAIEESVEPPEETVTPAEHVPARTDNASRSGEDALLHVDNNRRNTVQAMDNTDPFGSGSPSKREYRHSNVF